MNTFSEIVGNTALCRRLGDDILSSKLPHAIILEGPYGTGKHTIAKMTAAALVCEKKANDSAPLPCLGCMACKKVIEGKSPDVIIVGCEGKATIGVDAIRFLKEDVYVIPNDSDHKVYIIENADKMTPQAQNALLLTLEEPPAYAHFFLLCENAGLLLETIRSRAPVMRTELLALDDIDRYLTARDRRAAQMKLSAPKAYGELLVSSGNGIGRALELLEPKAFAPIKQTRALACDFVTAAVRSKGASETMPLILRFSSKREALSEQLETLSQAVRDLILLKKSDSASLSFFADRELAMELSDRASIIFLYELNEAVQAAIDEVGRNANVRLCLTRLALSAGLLE